jgi:UDP-N-acetylmuramoyl-tripeptide--D-alanyl-D-alanine ligase
MDVQTHLIGAYNLDNALAAACIGHYFEVPDEEVCNALSEYVPTNNRSQLVKTEKNTLIVDAYNANPTSMKAALDNFHRMDMPNKMIIIGDMRELGDASHEEHVKILQLVYKYAFPLVWLVGEELRGATTDMPDYSSSFIFFADVDEVKMALEKVGIKDRTILIKGSNSMRLYTLVESL